MQSIQNRPPAFIEKGNALPTLIALVCISRVRWTKFLAGLEGNLQGCRQGGGAGGAEAPPDFNTCYFTAKECWKTREEKQLSGYKHANWIKLKSVEFCCHYVQQTHWLTLHIGRLSVLFLWTCSIVHQFSRTCCAVVRNQVFKLCNTLKVLSLTALVAIRKIVFSQDFIKLEIPCKVG